MTADAAATATPALSAMVLTMARSDRMAGPIAVWSTPKDDKNVPNQSSSVSAAPDSATAEPFGFHDLINIVNPLQHIPVVSQIYRHLTGDTIKPVSQVLGDTLFGGALGGISSFINMLSTQATGHSLAGNAMALAEGKPVNFTGTAAATPGPALAGREQDDDSGNSAGKDAATVLRYSDLGNGQRLVYERVSAAGDRMAGSMVRIRTEDVAAVGTVPNIIVPVGRPAAGAPAAVQSRAPNSAVPSRT